MLPNNYQNSGNVPYQNGGTLSNTMAKMSLQQAQHPGPDQMMPSLIAPPAFRPPSVAATFNGTSAQPNPRMAAPIPQLPQFAQQSPLLSNAALPPQPRPQQPPGFSPQQVNGNLGQPSNLHSRQPQLAQQTPSFSLGQASQPNVTNQAINSSFPPSMQQPGSSLPGQQINGSVGQPPNFNIRQPPLTQQTPQFPQGHSTHSNIANQSINQPFTPSVQAVHQAGNSYSGQQLPNQSASQYGGQGYGQESQQMASRVAPPTVPYNGPAFQAGQISQATANRAPQFQAVAPVGGSGQAGFSPGQYASSGGNTNAVMSTGAYYPQPSAQNIGAGTPGSQFSGQQQHPPLPPGSHYPQSMPGYQGNSSNGYPQNSPGFQNQPGMQQGMQSGMPPPGPQFPGMAPVGPELRADGQPLNDLSGRRAPAPAMSNEMLPSVIDVQERDRLVLDHVTGSSNIYESRLNAVLPPLVTTNSRNVDCGNSVPELLRSSIYVAPCTPNLLKESGVPFVLHIQPMAELPVDAPPIPIVNHGEKGPVRCARCKAYMSPYMKFIDGGRKFQCPFCLVSTEVPQDYFAYLDSEGRRVDLMQRAELCLGTYEFLGTKDYCRNDKMPEPPAFIFMIDVSYRAVSSGMVTQVCEMLRTELESLLPVEANGQESKLRVGIATFSDSVHFFNLKAGLKQPNMMTVNDFSDMFVPLVDGFLVRLEESGQMFDKLLQEIPKIFADARQTDTILYPVVQAGMRALEAAGCPGKLFVFNFSLPIFPAPGVLKNRDDRSLLGTDKEKTLLKPQIPDYTELAKECVGVGCSVDLFLFPNSYIDVATLSEMSRLTGGQVYKYSYFTAERDGARFLWDLRRNLKRTIAFDAVMRVRTSAGIRPVDYFGNMVMPTTTEVHLASLDSDKVILAQIKHDDKLEDKVVVHFQVAILYTSLSAQRRVRVLNMALMSSNEFGELFRTAEIDVIMNFMIKNSVKGLYEYSPPAIREGLSERTTKMLAAYRKYCSTKTQAAQLVLPETLKLLPIYTACLIRNDIISGLGAEVGADDRSWLINHVNSLSVEQTNAFLYPRCFVLNEDDQSDSHNQAFRQVRAAGEKIRQDQAYLLENGVAMFMWLGSQLDPTWLNEVFGVATLAQIDVDKGDLALSARNNPTADQLRKFITFTRNSRPVHMRLMIIRQGDKMENWFRRFLVEDQGVTSFQQSYIQYIQYLHNAIRDEVEK